MPHVQGEANSSCNFVFIGIPYMFLATNGRNCWSFGTIDAMWKTKRKRKKDWQSFARSQKLVRNRACIASWYFSARPFVNTRTCEPLNGVSCHLIVVNVTKICRQIPTLAKARENNKWDSRLPRGRTSQKKVILKNNKHLTRKPARIFTRFSIVTREKFTKEKCS